MPTDDPYKKSGPLLVGQYETPANPLSEFLNLTKVHEETYGDAHKDEPPALTFLSVSVTAVPDNRNHTTFQHRFVTAWPTVTIDNEFDERALGLKTRTTKTVQDRNTGVPASSLVTIDQETIPVDDLKEILVVTELHPDYSSSWPELVDWDEDRETLLPVKIVRQIVDPTSVPPDPVAGVAITQNQLDGAKALRVTRTLGGNAGGSGFLPDVRTEYRNISYTFPSYLGLPGTNEFFGNVLKSTNGGRHWVQLNFWRRASYTVPVSATLEISYSNDIASPAPSSLFVIKPVDIIYDGLFFNVRERGVLTDGGLIRATITDNETWGDVVEDFDYTAYVSSPTATSYRSTVSGGVAQTVGSEIERWAYNLWRKVDTKVVMQ